jgi:hypothetical protein
MTQLLYKEKRDHLRRLVSETLLFGFSTNAALRYITDKLKVKIGERYYYQIRRKILEESETIIQYYSDNNNFIHLEQFINRITETELMRIKA